jgi:hypothetical protein
VSSGAGIFTLPMISLYCASKFALEGFSDAVAQILYDAATDGTDQLRYLVGDDSRGFIKAGKRCRIRATWLMRSHFLPKS